MNQDNFAIIIGKINGWYNILFIKDQASSFGWAYAEYIDEFIWDIKPNITTPIEL